MKLLNLITASLLLGAVACSAESAPGTTATEGQATPAATQSVKAVKTKMEGLPGVNMTHPHAVAAAASLETVRALVGKGNPEDRGFHSTDEVDSSTLTHPLPMFMIGLDKLRAYKGGDAHELLLDQEQVMYPLSVGGEVRTALVVRKGANGEYAPSSFGHATVAKAAHEGRQNVSNARGVAEADLRIVEIPTMAAKFLAHDEKGKLMLTPIYDVPGTKFHTGDTHSAEEVLAALQPIAAQLDPNVPN